jgi:sarcosine oxidase
MLVVGSHGYEIVRGSLAAAGRWGLQLEALDAPVLRSRFPWFSIPENGIGSFETGAGIVRPEAAVHASVRVACHRGAELRTSARVRHVVEDATGVSVETDEGTERASAVVIAAGAWTPVLLPELAPLLTVTRQVQAWFAPTAGTSAAAMPCWLCDRGPDRRAIYGLAPDPQAPVEAKGAPSPSRHPKVGLHGSDVTVDPDVGALPVNETDVDTVRDAYRACAPALAGDLIEAATCLYTMSPDGNFLVGTRRGCRRTHFAAGLSGHGFKLSPALGDALVDLAIRGRTDLPIGFLSPARFAARGQG